MPLIQAVNATISVINDVIEFINDFFDFLDSVAGFTGIDLGINFPNIPEIKKIVYEPLGDIIGNRIGMLLLENDHFMQDKLLIYHFCQ